ncbi:unnamed protein product [Caenorhabditis auriculariae]|uniref:Potassium channel domain-containing protein n=1 Tax=Caenorhabditis auriculariae TaxID=2777116 RepID=A0A8S1HDT4_9PELO|nr:unnamed protein product [Caenorhabditis auriculariae]
MEDQLKEIEGLLETAAHSQPNDSALKNVKKYIKLVFPHVALVAVVCLYAVVGAYIFYRLESPNEDREELFKFSEKLYKAFKEQYVRYADVRTLRSEIATDFKNDGRSKRHRQSKGRGDKGEKMWTASSALFFAATTMATIGYGNIVPATSSGRIACVVFALFGAPLAIITIGDLGKFLSECTIWLYKQMRKVSGSLRLSWRRMRGNGKDMMDNVELESSDSRSGSELDWEDLVMDKTEVPVLLVFTILLLYIAFGGVLFSFLEGWTYMDAFYYSFISLTTIGFGDIVPENHDYIVLMLVYLGVGLAVTTMCIDLVGIQYIQKIHYFGRKFRGTDLLHLLKRKRMIERRLAMGHGEEILQMYLQQIQKEMPEIVEQPVKAVKEEMKSAVEGKSAFPKYAFNQKFPRPPSIWSNSSASARSMMFTRLLSRGDSWDESGPSLSEHCSLSTEPSVHVRQAYWDNYRSPDPSVFSFEYEFPPPSPDYDGIAKRAKRARRIRSCPNDAYLDALPPSLRNPSTQSVRPTAKKRKAKSARDKPPTADELFGDPDPLLLSPPNSFTISEPFMLSKLAAQCDLIDRLSACMLRFRIPPQENLCPQKACETAEATAKADVVDPPNVSMPVPKLNLNLSASPPPRHRFRTSLFPIYEKLNVESKEEPLLKRKKRERLAKLNDPLREFDWLNVSPRTKIMQMVRDDLPRLFGHVRASPSTNSSNASSVVLVSPRSVSAPASFVLLALVYGKMAEENPLGMACMEDWDSYIQMLEDYRKPYDGSPRLMTPPALSPLWDALHTPRTFASTSESPPTAPSPYFTVPHVPTPRPPPVEEPKPVPEPRIEPPPPVIVEEPEPLIWEPTAVEEPVTVSVTPEMVPNIELDVEQLEEMPSPMPVDSSSSDEEETMTERGDLDLGAFELVDSGLNPETLLANDEPVIFHQSLPVHSVHHDTVHTEAALANLMSAPSSMLTEAIPPIMVEDNYCFVVDGERVRMGDILGDDQWWRHTSRPTKYFYSEDLRQFHRVNCITAKGKVITAKLASGILQVQHASSSSSTPRSSMSGGTSSARAAAHHRENKVPLTHVYKVIRFYSFWKTCTSFHRIVTMIDKVTSDERHANPEFKKRLFVQYLWRNAKAVEKARVQKEFDPRRQRLLRFVTDPSARKRFVEDESSMFAVIIDEDAQREEARREWQRRSISSTTTREDSDGSTIDFPIEINAQPSTMESNEAEVQYHYGNNDMAIPVFSTDEKPLDGIATLSNAVRCPVKYISKIPPTMVVDNFCFICDGADVSEEEILSDQKWWKNTSSTTRYYSTDNMITFHQVNLLTCRGVVRGAYRSRATGGGISRFFRVSRHFSYWKTMKSFHRIVSVISPAISNPITDAKFSKRIFVQYFWRSQRPDDKATVIREHMQSLMASKQMKKPNLSARNSWAMAVSRITRMHRPAAAFATSPKMTNSRSLNSTPRRKSSAVSSRRTSADEPNSRRPKFSRPEGTDTSVSLTPLNEHQEV